MKKWLWLLLFLGGVTFAQTTTTYTGTIRDLTGAVVTSGRVTFTLMPGVDTTISGTARFIPSTVACNISGSGQLTSIAGSACVVTNNTSLTPSGTYYQVNILPYYATPGSLFNAFALGGSVDITTIVPTPGTAPSYGYVPNQIWGSPAFLGFGTIQGTSTAGITCLMGICDFGNGTAGDVTGTIVAANVNGVLSATTYAGADIGAQTNAAVASCSNTCEVDIPPGTYSYSTSIALPIGINSKLTLKLLPGAVLTYTGSSYAINTVETGTVGSNPGMVIEGGQLIGTSAALGGVHLLPTDDIHVEGMSITGFSTGAGILIEGSEVARISGDFIQNNEIGLELIATSCLTTSPYTCSPSNPIGSGYTKYAPNAAHVIGNVIAANNGFNVYEQATALSGTPVQGINNSYIANDFEGGNGVSVEIDGGGDTVSGNYFETTPHYIVLGNDAVAAKSIQILNNQFSTPNSTGYDIEEASTANTRIEGNYETGAGNTCFDELGTTNMDFIVGNTVLSSHIFCAAGSPVAGPAFSIYAQANGALVSGVQTNSPIFNATSGFQIGGNFGANGQCLTSTGTGSAWGSCAGSGGTGTLTNFLAPTSSWPSWLVPAVTNPTSTPSLAVTASAIPNNALANQTANTVLGALTATTPSGLALPSCSSATNALIWTSGTGFGCNTISGFANPMTTDGDLIVGAGGGAPQRLAAGTDGYVLTANGPDTNPTWQPASGAGMVYPSAGVAVSTGSAWAASLAANNFAYLNAANTFTAAQTFSAGATFTGGTPGVSAPIFTGNNTASFTEDAGMGAGGSISAPACASGHNCTASSGTISFTTGNSPSAGVGVITVTFAALPNGASSCVAGGGTGATAVLNPLINQETTTSFVIEFGGTQAANTAYQVKYVCGD